MTRDRLDDELEVIAVEQDQTVRPRRTMAVAPRRPSTTRRALIAAVVVVVVGVILVVDTRHRKPSQPRPSPAEINARLSVQRAIAIAVLGDKIISRPVSQRNGNGPLGLIRLALPQSIPTPVLAVEHGVVLLQGSDSGGGGPSGTWACSVTGDGSPQFLGASDGFVPSVDGRAAWLTTGSTVRLVSVPDGTTLEGPYALDGRLVSSVGSGLLVQRGPEVVSWIRGRPAPSDVIGRGSALLGLGAYILWRASDGRLTISDSYTGQTRPTSVRIGSGQPLTAVALSDDMYRVAAAVGTTLTIGDSVADGRTVSVHLGPIGHLAWLNDNTIIALVGARRLVAVDASSGVIAEEPDFPFDVGSLAILPTNS